MRDQSTSKKLRLASWLPFVIGTALVAVLIAEVQFLVSRSAAVQHSDGVISLAQHIYRNRIDQETAVRAYVLTGDKRFLGPFYEAHKQALALEPQLQKLVADDPEQAARNDASMQASQAWSVWADQAIAVTRAGGDAGDVAFQLHGKELMDHYRQVRTDFIEREQQVRDQRQDRARRALEFVNASIVALGIIFALALAFIRRRQTLYDDLGFRRTALRNPAQQYAFALLILIVSTWVRSLLQPILGDRLPYPFFFVAVAIVSITCDLYPSLLVLLGTAVVGGYLFLPPYHSFAMDPAGWVITIIYVVSGCVIVYAGQTHRRSSRAFEEQKEWLHTTLTSIGDAVIATDADGAITLMNQVAEALTGWSLEEAKGKPLEQVFRIVNQETRQAVENPVEKVRHSKGVVGLANHTILISKDGKEVAIDDSGAPIFAPDGSMVGVVLVFRDVTDARKAEDRLAEQAGLLESAWNAIILCDESGRIRYWNPGAEKVYGGAGNERSGKITHDLLRTQFPQPLAEIVERIRREKHWQGELVHQCKNAEHVTVLSRWALLPGKEAAGPASWIEINADITRQKQLESALQSNERLALAGRLSASIAHEINNPLDAITNVLYLIAKRMDGQGDVKPLIDLAQREAQRVSEISKNMLSLHRESRSPSDVKVSELLAGVVALIEETIGKGRRRMEIVPGLSGEIETFPSELRQVFTNILKNAVEATAEDGEIKIYSEGAQESGQDGVLIRVVDNGTGIPEQLQVKLFTPFVTTKEESGTGLGLGVSRSILERHGGSIKLSDGVANRGTTVSIFLPSKITSGKSPDHQDMMRSESAS